MTDRTPGQQASYDLARAVFADPEQRARFEQMAKDNDTREPVPDDFSWLSRDDTVTHRNQPRTTAPTLGITREQATLSNVAEVIGNLLASGMVLDSYGALPGSDTHWRIEEGHAHGSFVVDGVRFKLKLHIDTADDAAGTAPRLEVPAIFVVPDPERGTSDR